MVTHPFPEKPEISNEDTATEVVEAPSFQIQHCSPAFFLHLHYFEDFNEEGAEFEVDGYSPCQQSSSAPSFQISESE
jgi:hypothetical protein